MSQRVMICFFNNTQAQTRTAFNTKRYPLNTSHSTDLTPDKLLSLARIAETAERYEDMCEFTSALVIKRCKADEELSVEERNLLSVAFKNVVGSKRASWFVISFFFFVLFFLCPVCLFGKNTQC